MSQADVRFKTFSEHRGQQHIQIDKEKFDWSHCMRRLVKNRIKDETEGFAPQLHEESIGFAQQLHEESIGMKGNWVNTTPVETPIDTIHTVVMPGTSNFITPNHVHSHVHAKRAII